MKAVKFELSTALISQWLNMPNNAKIVAANGEKAYEGIIQLIVEADDFPIINEGSLIPIVCPTITELNGEKVFKWNLPLVQPNTD